MTKTQEWVTIDRPVVERGAAELTDRELSLLVRPDVVLHQTKDGTERRHLTRAVLRVLSLAVGDVLAAGASAIAVRRLVEWAAAQLGHGRVPFSSTAEFCGAVLLALVLTGNYQRSDRPYSTLHLLVGSALGTLVVCWSNFWANPTLGAAPIAIGLTLVTTGALFLARGSVAALIAWLLPEHRRLVPAIVA